MRRSRVVANVIALLALLAALFLPITPAGAAEPFVLANGQFFPQITDTPGMGFAVRDDGSDGSGRVIRFWSEYQRLGGTPVLGYPVSRLYRDGDGFYYQLFQRVLLQWRPDMNAAVFSNVLDHLSARGADGWLAGLGLPSPVSDDGSGGDFEKAVQIRLGWLTQPDIKAHYLAASPSGDARASIERYGLPTSLPVRSGPFIVQRFQRVAFQLWLDNVPGMPAPGSVVPVLAGDLFRQVAFEQGVGTADSRFVPEAAPGNAPVARPGAAAVVADRLQGPIELLAANPEGRELAAALRSPGVQVVLQHVPAIAMFSPSRMTISINPEWADSDPRTLATVLAHEASHLADWQRGVDMISSAGCYNTEVAAFSAQARVWRAFYGQGGKPNPTNALDEELNRILRKVTESPQAFAAEVTAAYREECGR